MMKEQKGITLIALVITIIVLLILAAVSIAMLTGNNGILTRANDSKTKNAQAEVVDKINMELNAIYADVLADNLTSFEGYDLTQTNTNLGTDITAAIDTGDTTNKTLKFTSSKYSDISGKLVITGPGKATPTPAVLPKSE